MIRTSAIVVAHADPTSHWTRAERYTFLGLRLRSTIARATVLPGRDLRDPHGPRRDAKADQQKSDFLQSGGAVTDVCAGVALHRRRPLSRPNGTRPIPRSADRDGASCHAYRAAGPRRRGRALEGAYGQLAHLAMLRRVHVDDNTAVGLRGDGGEVGVPYDGPEGLDAFDLPSRYRSVPAEFGEEFVGRASLGVEGRVQ